MDDPKDHAASNEVMTSNSASSKVRPEVRMSAAVRRLLDEVRCDELNGYSSAHGYDRAHNRHNR